MIPNVVQPREACDAVIRDAMTEEIYELENVLCRLPFLDGGKFDMVDDLLFILIFLVDVMIMKNLLVDKRIHGNGLLDRLEHFELSH